MKISLWQFFRLVFVVFSLYLLGDAFFRWDGFSYYASFSEFLPSVTLVSIFWSILSVFTATFLWVLFKIFVWLCSRTSITLEIEQLLLFAGTLVFFGAMAWIGKKLLWPDLSTSLLLKLTVFLCVFFASILVSWFYHGRIKRWTGIVLSNITPVVWVFSIFVLISVPIVSYFSLFRGVNNGAHGEIAGNMPGNKNQPNIILVTFDALAAENMSLYGYSSETTPFISKWANNATVFTMAEAGSNFTTPAAASLMTGKRVWTHRTFHVAGARPVNSEVESLPAVLKANGYFNVALVVNPFASVKTLGMSGSFDLAPLASEFGTSASLFGWKFGVVDKVLYRVFGEKIRLHDWILKNDFIFGRFLNMISRNIHETTVPPDKVFDRFHAILDDDIQTPFFVWIHLFPPHDPYLPPEPFQDNLNNPPDLRSYKKQEKIIEKSYEYLFKYQPIPKNMAGEIELMRAYYDEFVRYVDKTYENFINMLNKRKIDNTLIVLTADHGESFEHGYFTHGGPFLYEQVTRIPLIIKEQDQNAGQVISLPVEQIDIPATILELANIPVPAWMEGNSFLPLMKGEKFSGDPVFAMNFQENSSRGHRITKGSIAVWEGDYKLIHYLEKNEHLLFNLKDDPEELYNIIDREPDISKQLLKIIKDNLKKANKK
jgi:arylsulfatase A-like enzyme